MPTFQRSEWKKVKDKHARALSAKKIVFNKDLGPTLDKLDALDQKMRKDGPDPENRKAAKKLAEEAGNVADSYQRLIHGKLGEPAESELSAQLVLMREWIRFKKPG